MSQAIATREAYGRALAELGAEDPAIVALDADLSKSTRTDIFAARFPGRFFDVGVAEQNLIGTACGMALGGKIPFASTFAVFAAGRAFDQVRNSVCHARLNVKIAATHGGITVGEDGASHQSIEDIALMRVLPNMTVIVPADAAQTAWAVQASARYRGPVYLRLGRLAVPQIYDDGYRFTWGRADVLREGDQAAIVSCGLMVARSLEAAGILAEEGIEVTVINMAMIKPLDVETLLSAARKTGAVVTAEEHSVIGGLGSAVAEVLGEHCPVPMLRVGLPDVFGESGHPEELMEKYGLTSRHLAAAVHQVLDRKRQNQPADLKTDSP